MKSIGESIQYKAYYGSKAIALLLVCFLINFSPILAQSYEKGSSQQVNWLTFEQLSDSIQSNPHKKVLISFHAEWCAYCRKMTKEVYTKPEIIKILNQDYFAVSFDAESMERTYFDGQYFVNNQATKKRKGFHELALLLSSRNGQVTLPATLILDNDFNLKSQHFEYLSPQKLIALLK